jgi:hypothetical protein
MKKISSSLSIGIFALSLLFSTSVQAADDTVGNSAITPPIVNLPATTAENTPISLNKENRLSKLIAVGTMRINERVASLNKLKSKIQSNKVLTADQKSSLAALIDQNISSLNNLLVKIKADTDIKVARADVQSIYTSFRIYAVFIPQINTLIALDSQANHIVRLTDRFVQVQARIDAAKAKGKDVTARQSALDTAKATLEQIKTKLAVLMPKAQGLKPADYPTTSKTTLAELRTGIKDIQKLFHSINASLKIAK